MRRPGALLACAKQVKTNQVLTHVYFTSTTTLCSHILCTKINIYTYTYDDNQYINMKRELKKENKIYVSRKTRLETEI